MSFEYAFYVLLTLLFFNYLIMHLLAAKGVNSLLARQLVSSDVRQRFSVIIAARNEEANIGRCLQSLVQQNYPRDSFELLVVDDRSTDETSAIVNNYALRYPHVRLLKVDRPSSDLPPKKNALNMGIKASRYDVLAFTDADCVAGSEWLSCLSREFLPDVGLVAGYSPIEQRYPPKFLPRWADFFLRYLEIKNSLGAAAAIGLDRSYLCTGRNLAYRKIVFEEVNGYELIKQSVSGDDDLFIQLVRKKTKWKMRYMVSPESRVETLPPASFSSFVNQRKRHFSAGNYYPVQMKIMFGLIHSFNALTLLSLVVVPFAGLMTAVAKFAVDGWYFSKGVHLLGDNRLLRSFIPLEIAAIFYNTLIGPLGVFGSFSWKGSRS